MDVYDEVVDWCEGGPIPNREEVLGALQWMIQERNAPIPPAPAPAPAASEGLDLEELAPNVLAFDVRFKDPEFVRTFQAEWEAAAIRAAQEKGQNPVLEVRQ
jgi:hypothetical protein